MPSVTIDGSEITFEQGESIIQVATRSGIDIPYYCWHHKLSVAANCRMCLVEVEKAPKLVPACQTPCRDGMVVFTENDKVKDAQRAVHEFLLINHPIDCPICDQAGECKLQNYYMKFQLTPSRMQETKVHKPRLEQLGPYVIYNGERCVLCTRCVRFTDEIPKSPQLGVFNRGDHAHIGTFPGQPLDNAYSLNVVDICPVGALTSSVFRFKQRVWNLRRSPSICPGCARGCNVHVDQRSGVVYRLLPRKNDEVNECWLCDEGRLTYERANVDRLAHCLLASGGESTLVDAQPAVKKVADLFGPLAQSGPSLGVGISLHATCEDAYVLGRLAKEVLGVGKIALLGYPNGEADELLRVADKNPNRAGIVRVFKDLGIEAVGVGELAGVKALLLCGHDTGDLGGLCDRVEVLVQITHARDDLCQRASVSLPALPWVQLDGTWQNSDGRLQRLSPAFAPEGDARPAHAWLVAIADAMGVTFAMPSAQTIRAEMERALDSFKESRLCEVGPLGHQMRHQG